MARLDSISFRARSMIGPLMVVVLGLIVGFIVVALFLPLVSLINAVSGGG